MKVLFDWFPGNSGVKGWIFKCSQQSGRECCFTPNFQQFYCVKACFSYPSQAFTARVNTWKSKPSHAKTLKISRKHTMCEGVNTFFGKSNAYTCARKKGKIHTMGMVGEVAFTSRRVVFLNRRVVLPNRRLVFSTRRLVFSNHWLVKPTPGVAKPTPGLVTAIRRGNFCLFGHQFAETVQLNDTLFAKNNLPL